MAITDKQMDDMVRELQKIEMERTWENQRDYDRGLMRSMQDELKHYWKFQTWLRFTHPEVIEEFKAVEDIERKANEPR